jgi:hypothetical protein
MAVYSGPEIVKDGLVLHLDAATNKSFRGEPTVNLLQPQNNTINPYHPSFRPYSGIGHGSGAISTEVDPPFKDMLVYRINEDGVDSQNVRYSFRFNCETFLSYDKIYTVSYYVYLPSIYAGRFLNTLIRMYQNTNGNDWHGVRGFSSQWNYYGAGNILLSHSANIDVTTYNKWQRISMTFKPLLENKNLPENNGNDNNIWAAGYFRVNVSNAVNGGVPYHLYLSSAQLEERDYMTDFIAGTRGTTVATGGGWADLSGNTNHGELVNGPTFNSDNLRSLVFDGVGNYIDIGATSNYFPTGSTSHTFSVSFWVKSTDTSNHIFFGNQQISNERIYVAKHSNTWDIGWGNFAWGAGNVTSGTRRSATPNWTHLTMNVSAGVASLYVDGEFTFNKSDTTVNITGNLPLGAYTSQGSLDTNNMKPVSISSCLIYNRALTAAEIRQNFYATRGRYGV